MAADITHDVALFNPGETLHNTIVLGGVNVVIPLELDMDGDPFQDDAVCLRSHGGDWEHVCLSSDPEVTVDPDARHLYYPFHDVPSGLFNVDVRIADRWVIVIANLLVSRGIAYLGDTPLTDSIPDSVPATDDPHDVRDQDFVYQLDSGEPCACGN